MPVTGWMAPRLDWVRQVARNSTGVYDWAWWVEFVRAAQTVARLGAPYRNLAYPVGVAFRTGIPGMASQWLVEFIWSGVRAPVAPAGAYGLEWRNYWQTTQRTLLPRRVYWDHQGFVGRAIVSRYYYQVQPWRREWAERIWTFGDPWLYRDFAEFEPDCYYRGSVTAASLRARFYY